MIPTIIPFHIAADAALKIQGDSKYQYQVNRLTIACFNTSLGNAWFSHAHMFYTHVHPFLCVIVQKVLQGYAAMDFIMSLTAGSLLLIRRFAHHESTVF